MSAVTSALLCLIVCFLVCSTEAEENITAEHGQDVTLTCKSDNNNKLIKAVGWGRPDLDPDYVFLYRDGHFVPSRQHPSYVNRVDLKDREMKDGDVSVVLKNVKMEDEGRYECHVLQESTNQRKRSIVIKLINIIYLKVLPPGDKDGGDKDGGDEDGGDEDGGDKDGGDKVRGAKDGGAKVGGDKAGIVLGVVGLMLLLVF